MQQEKERYMQEIQKQKDELCRQAESMQRTGQEPEKSQDPGTELPVSEYKNGTDALQSLADGATVMGQRLMEGIGQCVDLLEIGAARMEDVISRKLEEQADRMAEEERSNTKENKEE